MAVPVARVHLKVAHAALPALLPTPSKLKMMPLVSTPPFVAAMPPKPPVKPCRADANERWDARKTKTAGAQPSANIVRSNTGDGSSRRNNVISPPPKRSRCRASSPSSSATSSLVSNSKWRISRASSSSGRWDVRKKRSPPQAEQLDDGESSCTSTSIDDIDDTEEEEIVWKPRAMYAGPGFVVAAPEPSMIPMPTSFLVPVA